MLVPIGANAQFRRRALCVDAVLAFYVIVCKT